VTGWNRCMVLNSSHVEVTLRLGRTGSRRHHRLRKEYSIANPSSGTRGVFGNRLLIVDAR